MFFANIFFQTVNSNSLDTSFAELKFYILVQSSLHACSVTVVSDSVTLWTDYRLQSDYCGL